MKFEVISKYTDAELQLPVRKTIGSAGYDFQVAEDIVIPSFDSQRRNLINEFYNSNFNKMALTLEETAALTKSIGAKPTLVPTGIKCEMPEGFYLELSVRSSCPLKHWLILANGVGIIDSDYYNNPDNEGHIYFQMINLAPFDILLQKGDTIGQGILKEYHLTNDDMAQGLRTSGFGSTDDLRDYIGKRILANPIDDACEEECVMACNPERRAYIFGVNLAPGAETL